MTKSGVEGGRSRECGLVEYGSVGDARRAMQQLNDTELDGRLIFVREDREASGGGAPVRAAAPRAGGVTRGGTAASTGFRGLCLNCKQFTLPNSETVTPKKVKVRKKGGTQMCHEWTKKKTCKFGATCKFVHVGEP
jgi:RNA recognition motif-containing protein